MDNRFKLKFTATTQGQLLREAIAAYGISKRALTAIKFEGGELLVNDEVKNVRHPLEVGDEICVIFPVEEASEQLLTEYDPLEVVYEDDAILIINKPPFMSTIPSKEHPSGSVANLVRGHLERQNVQSTVHIVTRLDRDTSGLMVIAKHRHIHHLMSEMQKRGELHRQYEAVVHGYVQPMKLQIIKPIARKGTSIIEREVSRDGQFAHTDVEVLAHKCVNKQAMSHIRLTLHTGRTHQIRVHVSHIGHPLVGDDLYGGQVDLVNRQALHCSNVKFIHPVTQQAMHFAIKLPNDFAPLFK